MLWLCHLIVKLCIHDVIISEIINKPTYSRINVMNHENNNAEAAGMDRGPKLAIGAISCFTCLLLRYLQQSSHHTPTVVSIVKMASRSSLSRLSLPLVSKLRPTASPLSTSSASSVSRAALASTPLAMVARSAPRFLLSEDQRRAASSEGGGTMVSYPSLRIALFLPLSDTTRLSGKR
jgi:hypothetical protein